MRRTKIQIGEGSTLLAEQRFYDNTFLMDAESGEPILFILDAVLVRGPSGRERLRIKRDVIDFPDQPSMFHAVVGGGWVEAPVEDRSWRPERDQLEAPF